MSMPFPCPVCGNLLKAEDQICPACGRQVNPIQGTPPPVPVVTPPPFAPPPLNATPTPPPYPVMPAAVNVPVTPSPTISQGFTPGIPPVPFSSDHVISVIGMVTKKTGMFSSELYHMVITDKRLVFALQTKEMQHQDVNSARGQAKQQGKNFLGQIGAQMSTRSGEKYLGISPDLILSENPQNFAVNLDEVVKISTYHGDFEDNSPDSMEIKTTTQKMKFNISNYYNVDKQLKELLGSKVR